MLNDFNKTRVFMFPISKNQISEIRTLPFLYSKTQDFWYPKCQKQKSTTNVNTPTKKGFLLFDFKSRESETLKKFKKWIKIPKTKKYKKKRFIEEIYSIQTKQQRTYNLIISLSDEGL